MKIWEESAASSVAANKFTETSAGSLKQGDYTGDGKYDRAVFRPGSGNWFMQGSSAGTIITSFGGDGDRLIPNSYVP
ncbi:MAG TPA: hypothetical protein VIL74_25960 [Pyrinomonadaceae bacterium]|jgi:hypothetical protein